MSPVIRRTGVAAVSAVAAVALVSACSAGTSTDSENTEARTGVLAADCPSPLVIQADWEPQAEHGGLYALLGDEYSVDTTAKSVTGPLIAAGEDTGIDVEIRIGGSPVGYQQVQSLLYQEDDIFMGYGRVAETAVTQGKTPVTAVFNSLEKSPYAIYWDPETFPDVESIADLGDEDVTVLVASSASVWQAYLVGEGILTESQIDDSDSPRPATFVAAGGTVAEAGFATSEPYMYENETAAWSKPLELELLHDEGYDEYYQGVIVRSDDVDTYSSCLENLVPILQQAEVDYISDPGRTNATILDLVDQYDTGWVYSEGMAEWAAQQMAELGIVADPPSGGFGSFDLERVDGLIEIAATYAGADVTDLTADDLVTNQFIDPDITLK